MSSPNPFEPPKADSRPERGSAAPPLKSQTWQLVFFAFAMIGYYLAHYLFFWFRAFLSLSDAMPGAIVGIVGLGLGMAVAYGIKAIAAPKGRV